MGWGPLSSLFGSSDDSSTADAPAPPEGFAPVVSPGEAPQAPEPPPGFGELPGTDFGLGSDSEEAPKEAAKAARAYPDYITKAAEKHGLDPEVMYRIEGLESGHNPNSKNKYGYSGPFQMQPDEFASYGGRGDIFDPYANADAAGAKMANNIKSYKNTYGDDPDGPRQYMMWQQGTGGAFKHFDNGDQPAWESMYQTGEGQSKGQNWAKRAIRDNLPDSLKPNYLNVTSGDFAKIWQAKYDGEGPQTAAVQPQGAPPPPPGFAPVAEAPPPPPGFAPINSGTAEMMGIPPPPAGFAPVGQAPSPAPSASPAPTGTVQDAAQAIQDAYGSADRQMASNALSYGDVAKGAVKSGYYNVMQGLRKLMHPTSDIEKMEVEPVDTSNLGKLASTQLPDGYHDPKWWAFHMLQGGTEAAPAIAATAAATAAGAPALVAAGAGGLYFGLTDVVPAYERARQEGLSHSDAVARALEEAGISTATGTAMGLAPGLKVLGKTAEGEAKHAIGEALAQIFLVQPSIGAAGQEAGGLVEGRQPSAAELGTGYATNMAVGAGFTAAHMLFGTAKQATIETARPFAEKARARREAAAEAPAEPEEGGPLHGTDVPQLPPPAPPEGFTKVEPEGPKGAPGGEGLAPDRPSAEPIADLVAQAKDLADPKSARQGLWLPYASLKNVLDNGHAVAVLDAADANGARPFPIPDFDGQGGTMLFKNRDVAMAAQARVDAGEDMQAVIGSLVGSGAGKSVKATKVVQQKDAAGAVTRESAVTPEQQAETEKEFQAPGRTVETVTPQEAVDQRAEKIAAEQSEPEKQTPTAPFVLPERPAVPVKKMVFADLRGKLQINSLIDGTRQQDLRPYLAEKGVSMKDYVDHFGVADDQLVSVENGERVTAGEAIAAEEKGSAAGKREAPIELKSAEDLKQAAAVADADHTHAQGEANNRQLGHARWNGLDISLETDKDGVRRGLNPKTGETWESKMGSAYGYFKGTKGGDGMHVDTFIGPNPETQHAYVIDEMDKATGKFRQHKVMIGFTNEAAAKKAYTSSSGKRAEDIGAMTELGVNDLKDWLANGKHNKPIGNVSKFKHKPESAADKHSTASERGEAVKKSIAEIDRHVDLLDAIDARLDWLRGGAVGDDPVTGGKKWEGVRDALERLMPAARNARISERIRQLEQKRADIIQMRDVARPALAESLPEEAKANALRKPGVDQKAVSEAPKEVKAPETQAKPESTKSAWRAIGKNTDGNPVFEDERGVRSYTENGIRHSEPVAIVPTRSGVAAGINSEHEAEFEPVSGQTSLVPEATTKEQIAAQEKKLAAKGRTGDAMDTGMFGSSKDQTDLVDQAKAEPKPREPVPAYAGPELTDEARNTIVDMWKYAREVYARGKPESLASFLVARGGLKDDSKDVRHIAGEAKQRPGLVNKNGSPLDDAALRAWEAGFFPEHAERPTVAEFLNSLQDDLHTGEVVRAADRGYFEDLSAADAMTRELEDDGIPTRRFRTEGSLRTFLGEIGAAQGDGPSGELPSVEGKQGVPEPAARPGKADKSDQGSREASVQSEPPYPESRAGEAAENAGHAQAAEVLKPEEPKTPLEAVKEKLLDDGFPNIISARKFVKEAGFEGSAKEMDELVERAIVAAGREIVDAGKSPKDTYQALVELYGRQPRLASRTSESVANQAYSTPVPLAYLASRMAGVSKAKSVYEPSAGNGALLIEADPEKQNVYANELDPERAKALKEQGFKATSYDAAEKKTGVLRNLDADSVIANPPFGAVREGGESKEYTVHIDGKPWTTTAIEQAIALRALGQMDPKGKAVLIVGGVTAAKKSPGDLEKLRAGYRAQSKREFYWRLYNNYNVTDHFTVAGDLYERQGAGFPVDVIVIDGHGKSERELPASAPPRIYDDWKELGGLLDVSKNKPAVARGDEQAGGAPGARGEPATSDAGRGEANERGGRGELLSEPEGKPEPVRGGRSSEQPADVPALAGDASAGGAPVEVRDSGGANYVPVAAERKSRVAKNTNKAGQSVYQPASKTQSVGSLVPVNMADATKDALDRVEERNGEVDHYVGSKLGYEADAEGPFFKRGNRIIRPFSAEQIDAISLAIDNLEKANPGALILGDQTGIGKGRVVAGMLRYAMKKGMTPVFVTKEPKLYGDMLRDMTDIGMPEMLGRDPRVLMTNAPLSVAVDDAAVESETAYDAWANAKEAAEEAGEPFTEKAPKKTGKYLSQSKRQAEAGMKEMREGKKSYDMVFTTYDQMNTVKGGETERRGFVSQMVPNGMLVLDEAHEAGGAGPSARGKPKNKDGSPKAANRAEFTRDLVAKAKAVMYSSATYAKRPDVMDLYARTNMGKAVDDPKLLPELIAKGGVPLQQVVATMLSDDGQYIRRERSFDGVDYNIEPVPIDEELYTKFSEAVRQIFEFDMAVADLRSEYGGKELDKRGYARKKNDLGIGVGAAHSTAFSSIMHNIVGQMLLAIKATPTAEKAIAAWKAGEKPIIGLSNTMESFVKDYADSEGLKAGDILDLDFSSVLGRYLARTLRITVKSPEGKVEHVQIPVDFLGPDTRQKYKAVEALIENTNFGGLPVSPIDWMRHKLTQAGMKVTEITGRQMMIDYGQTPPRISARPRTEMGATGKAITLGGFNSGTIDAVILNRSGSTGVSMHANATFKDKRPRRMLLAQAEPNIDTHMQMLGRIHRTGQVELPRYSQVVADIPAEARPTAILMRKMASLNAATTASRKSVFMSEAVDFLNEYGDKVVIQELANDPMLNHRLGNLLKLGHENEQPDLSDIARKATGRLVLLPPKEQSEFLDRVTSSYKELIDHLNQTGENALEASTVDLQARPLDSQELKPRTGDSVFLAPVKLERVSAKAQGKAMEPAEIADATAETLGKKAAGDPAEAIKALRADGREFMRKKYQETEERYRGYVDMALGTLDLEGGQEDSKAKLRKNLEDDFQKFKELASVAQPGAVVRLDLGENGGEVDGIVVSVARSGKAKNPAALSAWRVTVAVPTPDRAFVMPMSMLYPPGHAILEGEKGSKIEPSQIPLGQLLPKFEESRKNGREDRYIITGNILAGYDQTGGGGQVVNYTLEDGSTKPGILLSRGFKKDDFLNNRAIRLATGREVGAFIDQVPPETEVRSKDGLVKLERTHSGAYVISMPAGRGTGGKYFTEQSVRDAVAPAVFAKQGNDMTVRISDRTKFVKATDAMAKLGALFQTREHQEIATKVASGAKRAALRGAVSPMLIQAMNDLEAGRTFKSGIQADKIRFFLKQAPAIVPRQVVEAVADTIEPFGPDHYKVTATSSKGETIEYYDSLDGIRNTAALFHTFPDGSPGIVYLGLESIGGIVNRIKGWRAHEGTHALRVLGMLPGTASENTSLWGRLVKHANVLRPLSLTPREFGQITKSPEASTFNPRIKLEDAYREYYSGNRNVQALIDEESVTHTVQLYAIGHYTDQDVAPIKDILDQILSGEVARRGYILPEDKLVSPFEQEAINELWGHLETGSPAFSTSGRRLTVPGTFSRFSRRQVENAIAVARNNLAEMEAGTHWYLDHLRGENKPEAEIERLHKAHKEGYRDRIARYESVLGKFDLDKIPHNELAPPFKRSDLHVVRDAVIRTKTDERHGAALEEKTLFVHKKPDRPLDEIKQPSKELGPALGFINLRQAADGRWEVGMIHVKPKYRGSRAAAALILAAQKEVGQPLAPSGILLPDGYNMLKDRFPIVKNWYRPHPLYGAAEGGWLSPKEMFRQRNQTSYWAHLAARGDDQDYAIAQKNRLKKWDEAIAALPPEAKDVDALQAMFSRSFTSGRIVPFLDRLRAWKLERDYPDELSAAAPGGRIRYADEVTLEKAQKLLREIEESNAPRPALLAQTREAVKKAEAALHMRETAADNARGGDMQIEIPPGYEFSKVANNANAPIGSYEHSIERKGNIKGNAQGLRLTTPHTVTEFFDRFMHPDDGASISVAGAYHAYTDWADEEGKKPVTFKEFEGGANDLGVMKAHIAGMRRFIGLRLETQDGEGHHEVSLLDGKYKLVADRNGMGQINGEMFDKKGRNVGRVYVRTHPQTIQLGQLHVDPGHQRKGLATAVQNALERIAGKPAVPDYAISAAEYGRWKKYDPAAVADYQNGKGDFFYTPSMLSPAYFAAQGGDPVPGSKAALALRGPMRSFAALADDEEPDTGGKELDQHGLYDNALEAVKAVTQEKGTIEQLRSQIVKAGGAGTEKALEAAGFDKAFPDPKAKTTRKALEDWLRANRVKFGKVVKGGEQWTVHDNGGEVVARFSDERAAQTYLGNLSEEAAEGFHIGREEPVEYGVHDAEGNFQAMFDTEREALEYLGEEGGVHHGWEVTERPREDADHERWSTPGGIPGSYREVVTTLPVAKGELKLGEPKVQDLNFEGRYLVKNVTSTPFTIGEQDGHITHWPQTFDWKGDPKGEKYAVNSANLQNARYDTLDQAKQSIIDSYNKSGVQSAGDGLFRGRKDIYTSSHWSGVTNPGPHYRIKLFPNSDGTKTASVQEIQFDAGEGARKSGAMDPAAIEKLTADFEKTKADLTATIERADEFIKGHRMGAHSIDGIADIGGTGSQVSSAMRWFDDYTNAKPNGPESAQARALNQEVRTLWDRHNDLQNKVNAARNGKLPDVYKPFLNTSDWVDTDWKLILGELAKDPTITRVSWTPGQEQAERYNLAQHISGLRYDPDAHALQYRPLERSYWETMQHDNGSSDVRPSDLPMFIGKAMAEQLLAEPRNYEGVAYSTKGPHTLDLSNGAVIGGEGMSAFYGDFDKKGSYAPGIVGRRLLNIVRGLDPEAAKIEPANLGKSRAAMEQWARDNGARLSDVERNLNTDEFPDVVHPSIPMTPKLRAAILKGLPMFGGNGKAMGQLVPSPAARPALQQSLEEAVNHALGIVHRIAGKTIKVALFDTLPGEGIGTQSTAELNAIHGSGKLPETAGGFYMPGTLDAQPLIGLAFNDPLFNPNDTAGHEAWHHVKETLASPAEKKLLASPAEQARMRKYAAPEWGLEPGDARMEKLDPREVEAFAFQRYRREQEEGKPEPGSGLHMAVKKLFKRILDVLHKVRNVLRGLGYKSYEDVFEDARSGGIAERADTEAMAREIEQANVMKRAERAGRVKELVRRERDAQVLDILRKELADELGPDGLSALRTGGGEEGLEPAAGRSESDSAPESGEPGARRPIGDYLRFRAHDLLGDKFSRDAIDARATAQAWHEGTWYHGTNRDVDELVPSGAGYYKTGTQYPAVWLSNRGKIGSGFAMAHKDIWSGKVMGPANVIPARIRGKLKVIQAAFRGGNFATMDKVLEVAHKEGYAGVLFKNLHDHANMMMPFGLTGSSNVVAMFAGKDVRSVNDMFDERAVNDSGLLASAPYVEEDIRGELNRLLRSENMPETRRYSRAFLAARAPRTPAEEAVGERIVVGHVKNFWNLGSMKELAESSPDKLTQLYAAAKDNLYPVKRIEDAMAGGNLLKNDPDKSSYMLMRLTRGNRGRSEAFIMDGAYRFSDMEKIGPGLKEIIDGYRENGGSDDGFEIYAVSKRALEYERRGLESGVDTAQAREVIAQGTEKYEQAFRQSVRWNQQMLAYMRDAGVISNEAYVRMTEENKDYTPFYRLRGDEEYGTPTNTRGMRVRQPIHRVKGGAQQIVSPIESMVKNAFLFIDIAEKNRALLQLKKIWEDSGDIGKEFMQKVKQPVRPITVTEPEVAKFLDDQGIDAEPESFTIFRPNAFNPGPDEIALYADGKKEIYKVGEDVAKAIKGLTPEGANVLTKIMQNPASWLRAGAVTSPEFVARNPFRDQFSALVFSDNGYVPVWDFMIGAGHLWNRGDEWAKWMKSGGAGAAMVSIDRHYINHNLIRLDAQSKLDYARRIVMSPIEALRIASEAMENATRMGEFLRAQKNDKSLFESGFDTREVTLDFGRSGDIGQVVNQWVPFFNANAEGVDRAARAFKDNPMRFTLKTLASITLLSFLTWLWNHKDKRWYEIPNWEKDLYWVWMTDKWVDIRPDQAENLTDDPTYKRQLPNGQWQQNMGEPWRFPKPFELGVMFGSGFERMLSAYFDANPHAYKDLAASVGQALLPPYLPTAFTPLLEQWANKSFFLDRPLVPKAQEHVLPAFQQTPYTSSTAKLIAQGLAKISGDARPLPASFASPIIVDNYIREWGGGLGQHMLSLADSALHEAGYDVPKGEVPTKKWADEPFVKAFTARYPSASSQSVQDFYDTYEQRADAKATASYLKKSGRADEVPTDESMQNATRVHKALGVASRLIRDIQSDPKMTGADKRQLIDATYLHMIELAQQGNQFFAQTAKKDAAE